MRSKHQVQPPAALLATVLVSLLPQEPNHHTSLCLQDPLSLVPWMNALFALADAGCSSFDTGGAGWPPCPGQVPLTELLAGSSGNPAAASAWLYGGAERVLGVFKRRWAWSGAHQADDSQCCQAGIASKDFLHRMYMDACCSLQGFACQQRLAASQQHGCNHGSLQPWGVRGSAAARVSAA
jgi:hypothetical protein